MNSDEDVWKVRVKKESTFEDHGIDILGWKLRGNETKKNDGMELRDTRVFIYFFCNVSIRAS